jgi:hypothetical protein
MRCASPKQMTQLISISSVCSIPTSAAHFPPSFIGSFTAA